MRSLLAIFIGVFVLGCNASDSNDNNVIENNDYFFIDSFESVGTFDDLFTNDGSRWTTFQQVNPNNEINEIEVVNTLSSEGNNSLRLFSNPSNEILSKIDIEKGGFKAHAGKTITIKADFYINTQASLADLFLIDLECCTCWDPLVDAETLGADNQCPGIRLKLSATNDYLSIERGKISAETLTQSQLSFPKQEWVTVIWETYLSDTDKGTNSLKINDTEVISTTGMNLPNATIFKEVFAENNIDFNLQTPVFYERVQVGATANPSAGAIEMFVDNVSISIE